MKMVLFAAFFLLASSAAWAATGIAEIKGTAEGSNLGGTVKFEDTSKGLKILAELSGVPAGDHGFHIHELGFCGDSGKAAGSHYNPLKTPHGMLIKDGLHKAHAGDMGNVTAGADGKAVLEIVLAKVSLSGGKHDVAGRAVVIHEKADDFGQPVGNAGSRIGCGIIVITGN